jgi:hypothetical protein
MHLNARNSLKAFVPARCKAGSGEEHISITRRVTDKSSDVLFELLVTRRVRSREYLGSNQICHNALDVSTGVGPKCQSKSAGVGMKFDKSFNCAQGYQDREGLVELLDYVEWFARQRVMTDHLEPQGFQQLHRRAV